MTDIDKQYQEDIEFLKNNYSKEMQEYEKIGNRDNFNKIIDVVRKLNKYEIELDSFYSDEDKILGITQFHIYDITMYFNFHDFCGFDAKADMEDYLKGKKYNLELWLGYDIADFETLENSYKAMKEVKKIIDDVIDGGNKDE